MNDRVLELRGIAKAYANGSEALTILRDVNLSVEAGRSVVIQGESGSGKTTLLNIIGGLDWPDRGDLVVDGKALNRMDERELTRYRGTTIGFIFQFHYLLRDFTAVENVLLPSHMLGVPRPAARERAKELLAMVRLSDRLDHYPHQLSGGERQRVAVARALVNDPKIVLGDEPTGNLDEGNSRVVEDLIFSLVETLGKTLVLVTHDARLAGRGERRVLLSRGELSER